MATRSPGLTFTMEIELSSRNRSSSSTSTLSSTALAWTMTTTPHSWLASCEETPLSGSDPTCLSTWTTTTTKKTLLSYSTTISNSRPSSETPLESSTKSRTLIERSNVFDRLSQPPTTLSCFNSMPPRLDRTTRHCASCTAKD
jgi:hypothetical protein